ncbi:hypothetical protein ILUMI_11593 [Ignelater luminosus]|uniref:DDE Tnp4 domain-containing protein n=1 Tax=Ignelater luminosus TaxID=2038154 RepID=A0A8K0GDS9_IGNLU|nr:hypothetical protein ILUMI_11593 [Ignelater luminosus]
MDIVNLILENEMLEDNNVLVYIAAGGALELAEPIALQVANRRHVPRNQDYYEVTIRFYMGDLFTEHFRRSRETFQELVICVGNAPSYKPSRTIPLEKKVMFAVCILAKPESFLAAGDRFGLARNTAHVIFREIVGLLVEIMPQFITWPRNHDEAVDVFHEQSHGFPGVVGAIDGCHMYTYQAASICNHRKVFLNIHVGMPGRVHDARVLRNSPICNSLTNKQDPLLTEHQHLIGDSAYPLMKNLLTPFRDNGHLTAAQNNYNYKLSSIRSVIERAFGLLKGKFRRLKYLDIGEPDFGTQIITSSCVLHNFILLHSEDNEKNYHEGIEEDLEGVNKNPEVNKEIAEPPQTIANFLNIKDVIRTDHLNVVEWANLIELCSKFKDVFHHESCDLSVPNAVKQKIRTKDDAPVHIDKSEFLRKEVGILGEVVTPKGIKSTPEKTLAVQEYPMLKTVKEIKMFLGLRLYQHHPIDLKSEKVPDEPANKRLKTIHSDDSDHEKIVPISKQPGNHFPNEIILDIPTIPLYFSKTLQQKHIC